MIQSVTWARLSLVCIALTLVGAYWLGTPMPDRATPSIASRIPSVSTQLVVTGNHQGSLQLYGQINALETVDLVAAVPGVIQPTRVQFQSGIPFKKGDILIAIDNREQRYQLNAATSAFMTRIIQLIAELDIDYPDQAPPWRQFLSQIQLDHPLPELPNSDTRIHYRLAALGILSDYYAIQKQAVVLEKYTVMAPFDGAVKTSAVRPNTYVSPGQPLGTIMDLSQLQVHSAVRVEQAQFLDTQRHVQVQATALGQTWVGTLNAINANIDPTTQSVPITVTLPPKTNARDGTHVAMTTTTQPIPNVMRIDQNLLINNTTVYGVDANTLVAYPVTVVLRETDTLLVRGLPNNGVLLSQPVPGAYAGMPVQTTP
ncbi:MAG: efflux RND transporter periplasmic adaptor subunit [Candidatus Marinamargulisbacteria bacterium]|nr:efflux RND transporter periplasmic adaptor subunit [Candidatus Marinamargulisbacteria bacterium]